MTAQKYVDELRMVIDMSDIDDTEVISRAKSGEIKPVLDRVSQLITDAASAHRDDATIAPLRHKCNLSLYELVCLYQMVRDIKIRQVRERRRLMADLMKPAVAVPIQLSRATRPLSSSPVRF